MAMTRGVSLYSLQDNYYNGQMTLADEVRFVAEELGATGIELLAEQTPVGSYPNPSDSDVAWWKDLMAQYGTTPTCMDSFLDSMLYKGRILTKKEQVEQMEQDLRLAARLGFDNIRVLCPVRAEVVEASIPIAEYYGVKMGLEIHAPMHFEAPWAQRYFEMAERTGSKYVCVTPDFGIFQYRPNTISAKRAVMGGASEKIMEFIVGEIEKDSTCASRLAPEIRAMGGGEKEISFAMQSGRLHYNDPELLRTYGKYICHFHAKFYEIDPVSLEETGINYADPIRILKEMNWSGCLSSEFEGQSFYQTDDFLDCSYETEQLKLQHRMLKKYLGV